MTFRKLMFLGGLGGLAYWHRKNGGQWTIESFKQSGRDLMSGIRGRIDTVTREAQNKIHDVAGKVVDSTDTSTSSTQRTGFESDAGFRTRDDLGYSR